MSASSSKCKDIPIPTKLSIVKRYKQGEKLFQLEKETGFQRQQIKNWAKNEQKLANLIGKHKRKRLPGSGPSAKFEEIEKHLITWFISERDKQYQVNYQRLREKAHEIAKDIGVNGFACSNKWIFNFCKRNKIGNRRITHRGQQDSRSEAEISEILKTFLIGSEQFTAGYDLNQIYNMDETPCYFDMASDQTLHFKGAKNVDGVDTGHRKSRFTVVLCCSGDGRMIKTLIIFKGLKNVPKLNLPSSIEVTVSMGGSMNTGIMLKWVRSCFTVRGPFLSSTKSLLYMDSFGSHLKEEVSDSLERLCNTKVVVIPPKTTSILQPLDVSLNSPFKTSLRQSWLEWLTKGPKEMTKKGYRRRPSYQAMVDMVSKAVKCLSKESIQKSFRCCGIAANGQVVPRSELNGRLKSSLEGAFHAADEDEENDFISDDENLDIDDGVQFIRISDDSSDDEL